MREQKPIPNLDILERHIVWRFLKSAYRGIRVACLSFLAFVLLFGFLLLYLKSRPLPTPDLYRTSNLYDEKGRPLGPLDEGEHREPVRLSEVPQAMIDATLAAEDKTFFTHHGFSLTGIARAAWANVKHGEIVQGASTITQQLARNLYLTHDRTWARKLKEAILTAQLELHFSKRQILEMYLNEIYYGHGIYGIARAAEIYFNKKVSQLNLAECAFLAGIPRGPYYYSPYLHPNRAIERQKHILSLMRKNGTISEQEMNAALRQPLAVAPRTKPEKLKAHYFRDYLIHTAVTRYGLDESLVRHGGLKIYTTLNPAMQAAAEKAVKQYTTSHADLEGALISVDPHTGHIKAMVGGKDYQRSQFNRVFAKRQPGSVMKPVLYLRALEKGFTPLTKIPSQPTVFYHDGKPYIPRNYQNRYANRPITLREAIARSDNIYAVSTLFRIGAEEEMDAARRLGIRSHLSPTPSLALGSYDVTPFEIAEAYATIASGGVRHPLTAITKIVDPYGRVLVEEKPAATRVTSSGPAFVLTKLMGSVFEPGGTGYRIRQLFHRPAAGKTGTTDRDGWLAGFTPDLVTAVWVGYDQGKILPHSEARLSQLIWAQYMREATRTMPLRSFAMPADAVGVSIDPKTGHRATPHCPHAQMEYFVRGTEPTTFCPEHPAASGTKGHSLFRRLVDWWRQLPFNH